MKELVGLGMRIRQQRIALGMKQKDLAERAAVSSDSLSALEHGRTVSTKTLACVLGALGHKEALENLLPVAVVSPIDLQKLHGKQRKRVR